MTYAAQSATRRLDRIERGWWGRKGPWHVAGIKQQALKCIGTLRFVYVVCRSQRERDEDQRKRLPDSCCLRNEEAHDNAAVMELWARKGSR